MRVKILSIATLISESDLEDQINEFCKTVHMHDIVIDWGMKFVYITYWEALD